VYNAVILAVNLILNTKVDLNVKIKLIFKPITTHFDLKQFVFIHYLATIKYFTNK
jgi:hypothetical protein